MLLAPQDDAAATEALSTFEAGFQKTKDSSSRAALVSTLAKTHHEKVVNKLGSLLTHEDKGVRTAAAQGLAGYMGATPELKKSAAHALSSGLTAGANTRDPDVMAVLLGALGSLQEESSGQAIKTHFEDKDGKIASAAVTAAGALKSKSMIDPLIELLRECEKQAKPPAGPAPSSGKSTKVPKAPKGSSGGGSSQPDPEAVKRDRAANLISSIVAALQNATGQNCSTGDEWEKWWSKNRGTFTPAK
jgi:HEAT repeat protein